MKRNLYGLVLLIMAFGMLLSFVACQEVLNSEAELLEKAREVWREGENTFFQKNLSCRENTAKCNGQTA